MCGIIYVKRKDGHNAKKSVLKRYEQQKNRGMQGYGYIAIKDGHIKEWYQSQNEEGIKEALEKVDADEILFHHRYPTSTPNVLEATHPIAVSHKDLDHDYYVVHNGVISNPDELKKKYEEKGYIYNTKVKTISNKQYIAGNRTYEATNFELDQYNDSESFAIDLAILIEEGKLSTESYGSIAFIAIQTEKNTDKVLKVFFGRNTRNPLKLDDGKDLLSICSEGNGKEVETNRLFCIEGGKIKDVKYIYIGGYASTYNTATSTTKTSDKKDFGFSTDSRKSTLFDDDEYDDFGGTWNEDLWGKRNHLVLEGKKEEITEDDISYDIPFASKDDKGIVIWGRGDFKMEFEDLAEFEEYYFNLIEEIAEAEDELKIAVEAKEEEEVISCTSRLNYLREEMWNYDEVYTEVREMCAD